MSATKQTAPHTVKTPTPTAVDPAAQLRAGRDRLAQLQREEAEIGGHIRVAILAEDGTRVSALTARQTMLPALNAEAATIADAERAHRAVTEQADRDRAAAFDALRAAEQRYGVTIVEFQAYTIRREDVARQRRALRDRLGRLATADEPVPAA
jgi:hypothetical protein